MAQPNAAAAVANLFKTPELKKKIGFTLLGPVGTGKVRIEQVRSGIGHHWRMRRTLAAIGLKHHQDVVVKTDSPSLRGQLKQVRHLIRVSPAEE